MGDNLWYKRWEAHRWFDKLWQNHEERQELYQRLADHLEIDKEKDCHFATMSEEQLDKSINIIKKWWWEKYDK